MNQQELWESPTFERAVTPARNRDPLTSKHAAEELHSSGRAGTARMQMYHAFRVRPMTANEAAQYCVEQNGGSQETYRKRVKELERQGAIVVCSVRACGVTGKQVQVYKAVK